jgi:recombination protein RecT
MTNTENPSRSIVDRRKIVQEELQKFEQSQLLTYLPPKVAEQYRMAFLTLLGENPKLYNCSNRSLFSALLKAARDGLMPNGIEAAIIPFQSEGGKASDSAVYIPMIQGIRKKARASGEIADWYSYVAYRGDEFDFQLGDEPYVKHKPKLNGGSEREMIAVYSVARFRDGNKSIEVMGADEIEEHRDRYSRAKSGPWYEPITRGEMARKTVMRRHAKSLPLSNDVYSVVTAEDELVHEQLPRSSTPVVRTKNPGSVKATLDEFAGEPEPLADSEFLHNPETGEPQPPEQMQQVTSKTEWTPPTTPTAYFEYATDYINHLPDKESARRWFNEPTQRQMRKTIGIEVDAITAFHQKMFGK